jgi:hypothetical protein
MAFGPAPKDKHRRARNNKEAFARVELEFEPGERPELPTTWIDKDGDLHEFAWSPLTQDWWNDWCLSPQAKIFSRSDWRSLLSTAFIAEQFHRGFEVKFAAELRLREAQFGATPMDRLRLRMSWREDAERGFKVSEAEEARRAREQRYADIHVINPTGTEQ